LESNNNEGIQIQDEDNENEDMGMLTSPRNLKKVGQISTDNTKSIGKEGSS